MAQTTPPTVDALPTPPQTSDPTNFDSRADAWVTALLTFTTQIIALAANVYNNAVDAFTNAVAAAASQVAALASQVAAANSASAAGAALGAPQWVSGTTYAARDPALSPATRLVYRRITAGAGTTDPSADPTNWAAVAFPAPQLVIVTGTTHSASVGTHVVLTNVAATTVTLPVTPTTGDVIWITPGNGLTTNVVGRNGNNIMSLAQDMTIDYANVTLALRYINSTIGWRLT